MEKSTPAVIFKKRAENSIFKIYLHVVLQGYPETAEKFAGSLYDFGYTLNDFPDKYSLCRFRQFAKHKLHCAVFEHNYIFVYKMVKTKWTIYNVISSKRLK